MMPDLTKRMDALPSFVPGKDLVHVVIETPQGSRNKYVWEPGAGCFKLKKILPAGTSFPLDFGFIPGTRAGDGDALDAIVMMDAPAVTGALVECRVVGAMEAVQWALKGKRSKIRNDRIIAVPDVSRKYSRIKEPGDIEPHILNEVARFFEYYNRMSGKMFEVERISGPRAALKLIRKLQSTPGCGT